MTSYKNASKGELVAIYRLEFYKNKKKWKFCKNERQLKKDVPAKQKLNETYRVEEEAAPEVEPPEPLNDAFLETDSDEHIKEELKPSPPPPTLRRRRNTILDMKLPPEERDWAIPNVKAEQGWEPSIEPVRSYEDECGEAGWEKERWGDDMQCVEQVYASELCLAGAQRSRLPVFAGWPAPHQPSENMLQDLVQNLKPKLGPSGPLDSGGQHIGQFGQHNGNSANNAGRLNQNIGQINQNAENFGHIGHFGQPVGQFVQNAGHFGQNVETEKIFGHNMGQILRQNTEILDVNSNFKCMNRNGYIEVNEPEILKQNIYQNCKIGQVVEQNFRREQEMDFEDIEWEPERDCELGRGMGGLEGAELCVGDACVAGAVAALAEAEGWLTGPLKHFYLEPALGSPPPLRDVSQSSGDSAAFVRGAHARPHSSEVELAADTPCECEHMSVSKLAHMSGAALREALRAHTRAVRCVLAELTARARQANIQPSPLSGDVTHESLPTRDTQPPVPAPRDTLPQAATPRDTLPPAATPPDMPPGRGRGRRLLATVY